MKGWCSQTRTLTMSWEVSSGRYMRGGIATRTILTKAKIGYGDTFVNRNTGRKKKFVSLQAVIVMVLPLKKLKTANFDMVCTYVQR